MGRRLGQHFLAKKSILDQTAIAACGESAPLVVEIGPGKGALTESLLEHSEKVVAIEVDPYLVHYLQQKFRGPLDQGRLILIEGDVLKADLGAWGPAVIAGNLPYYITSPIIEKLLQSEWKTAVFLVQAEVAARLAAGPGSRDFGYLSVQTQLHAEVESLFQVSRAAFRPPPKVDSAVVRLKPVNIADHWKIANPSAFLRFASHAFRHKRKTLRNNLAPIYGRELVDTVEQTRMRAEQLGIPELAALFLKLEQARSSGQ